MDGCGLTENTKHGTADAKHGLAQALLTQHQMKVGAGLAEALLHNMSHWQLSDSLISDSRRLDLTKAVL